MNINEYQRCINQKSNNYLKEQKMKSNSIIKGSLSLLPAIFLLAVLIAAVVNARDDGMTGRTLMTNTNGCNCHGSRDLNTSVLISGPAVVNAGQTYNYNVSISISPRTELELI
jgi:hypothetical protein